jgi:hypothetical protein
MQIFQYSIGVSPAQLLYGNAINLNRGIFLSFEAAPKLNSLSKFTQEMLETQNKLLHEASKQQQAKRFAHLAKDRFQGEPTTQFPVNSFVLVQETLTHRSNPKRKSSMELKVGWQGYNSNEDT